MDQGRQNPLFNEQQNEKPMNRKVTNQITIQENSEINKISIENLPKNLRQKIYTFKALHYFLLIVAIISIVVKRVTEYDDIKYIESKEKQEDKDIYYLLSGLIYVKYNCEILNFVIFKVFIKQLQEKTKNTFVLKMVIESLMIFLYICKLVLYLAELKYSISIFQGLTYLNIILEVFLMCVHIMIIVLYVQMRKQFLSDKLYRKIFLVYYLKEKLQVKNKQFIRLIMGQVCNSQKTKLPQNFSNFNIHMECSIWYVDQNGLYNLKAQKNELKKYHYKIYQGCFVNICAQNNQVYFDSKLVYRNKDDNNPKFKLFYDSNSESFKIELQNEQLKHNQMLWSNIGKNGKKLNEGNIIKLGKQLFRVNKIKFSEQRSSFQIKIPDDQKQVFQDIQQNVLERSQNLQCRICLDLETEEKPFERFLCPCSRTMPAHISCLKEWIQQQCVNKIKEYVFFCDFNSIACDICKQKYPQKTNLLNLQFDQFKNYLKLDKICQNSGEVIGTYIINLDNEDKRLTIGRHTQNDIVQNDIQISRFQAEILIKNQELYLFDLNSKFGSFINYKQQFDFSHNSEQCIFIDKFRFKFHIFKKTQQCLCQKKNKFFYSYQKQTPIDRRIQNIQINSKNVSLKISQNSFIIKSETESEDENQSKILFTHLSTPVYNEEDKENFIFEQFNQQNQFQILLNNVKIFASFFQVLILIFDIKYLCFILLKLLIFVLFNFGAFLIVIFYFCYLNFKIYEKVYFNYFSLISFIIYKNYYIFFYKILFDIQFYLQFIGIYKLLLCSSFCASEFL